MSFWMELFRWSEGRLRPEAEVEGMLGRGQQGEGREWEGAGFLGAANAFALLLLEYPLRILTVPPAPPTRSSHPTAPTLSASSLGGISGSWRGAGGWRGEARWWCGRRRGPRHRAKQQSDTHTHTHTHTHTETNSTPQKNRH